MLGEVEAHAIIVFEVIHDLVASIQRGAVHHCAPIRIHKRNGELVNLVKRIPKRPQIQR